MCRYYAHNHRCGHTRMVFAAYCAPAALIQRACASGEIWQTLRMETACSRCFVDGGDCAVGGTGGAGGTGGTGAKRGPTAPARRPIAGAQQVSQQQLQLQQLQLQRLQQQQQQHHHHQQQSKIKN